MFIHVLVEHFLEGMGWKKHYKVNITLTIIALIGVVLMELGY